MERLDPQGTTLLTPDTYLAIETGRSVPQGLEMGSFSFFPELSTSEAMRYQVTNLERLSRMLQDQEFSLLAISDYVFRINSPSLSETTPELLKQIEGQILLEFTPSGQMDAFGQQQTLLRFYSR